MATRSRPSQSIDILRETWSTFLDPSLNPPEIRPWGSKALINACMDYRFIKSFSKRTKLSKLVYDTVVARWPELGLTGTPPVVSVFEDERSPTGTPDRSPLDDRPSDLQAAYNGNGASL
jgi:4-hydroxy-3-polyprenylbenzoate decarboxylase